MRFLLLGLSIGFGAGLAPGPLAALVVTTTLSRGFWGGVRVAFSPLVTDVVVIVVAVFVVRALPTSAATLLGVGGGLFVVWLGIEALREKPAEVEGVGGAGPDPLRRGALVNLLSPHPWLFWMTVGGPLLVAAWGESPGYAVVFLVAFYVGLVGTKVAMAAAVAGGRRRLTERGLRRAHLVAGILLVVTGVVLAAEFALHRT